MKNSNVRFVAGLYKKIELFDNLFVFKLQGVTANGYIDLNDKKYIMNFEMNNQMKKVLPIEEGFSLKHNYYYDNEVSYNILKEKYPDVTDDTDLVCKYLDDIHDDVILGYYDEEENRIKVFTTNEHFIKNSKNTNLMHSFFEVSSDGSNLIQLPIDNITTMLNLIKNKEYDYVEKYLNLAIDQINQIYKANNIPLIEVSKKEQIDMKEKSIDEIYEIINQSMNELNEMIGISEIKNEINKFTKLLILKQKTKEYLNLDDINMNMVFTGNPGTGKTTVARIIGKILYNLGYSQKEKVAEVTAKDLIGEYVGQTSVKTAELIEEYKGGVIFIDEAYSLSNEGNSYANDALVEIIKELERRRTIFIFAGYTEEMRQFIEMNSGIASRIGYNLEYNDYSEQELVDIFLLKATKRGFIVDEDLKDKLLIIFEREKQEKHFGNGRFVDNLLDKIIFEHSVNTEFEIDKDVLIRLTLKDLETVKLENNKAKTKKIGFM